MPPAKHLPIFAVHHAHYVVAPSTESCRHRCLLTQRCCTFRSSCVVRLRGADGGNVQPTAVGAVLQRGGFCHAEGNARSKYIHCYAKQQELCHVPTLLTRVGLLYLQHHPVYVLVLAPHPYSGHQSPAARPICPRSPPPAAHYCAACLARSVWRRCRAGTTEARQDFLVGSYRSR
jgi:hypothetical protein